jgi:hypothetical protein
MVLMNAGRAARNVASIVNRPTCGGGSKKSGLAPRVGWYLTSNVNLRRAAQSTPQVSFCISTPTWPISTTIQTQSYGYRATHGGNMG